jgi:hypothetical protein
VERQRRAVVRALCEMLRAGCPSALIRWPSQVGTDVHLITGSNKPGWFGDRVLQFVSAKLKVLFQTTISGYLAFSLDFFFFCGTGT